MTTANMSAFEGRSRASRPGNAPADAEPATNRIVLTPSEVAALIGVSRATVYRWIAAGHLPVVQMGESRMFIPARPLLEMFGATRSA